MTGDMRFAGPPAMATDYPSFVSLSGELGTEDPVPALERWLKELAPTTLFLRAGAETLAYAYFNLLGETGYVRHVVVAPSARGKGLGRAVMGELASRFRAAGMTNWCLNVKPENLAAVRLYESVGMKRAHSSCALRLPWELLTGLPPSAAAQSDVRPTDDAPIESAFGLPAGQIADYRAKGSRVLLWLSLAGRPVGFAAFDPTYPGAFPFRVGPEHARALLEAMQRRARAEVPYVQVVAEDNAPLVRVLVDAGAEVKMAFDHYRGVLPPD